MGGRGSKSGISTATVYVRQPNILNAPPTQPQSVAPVSLQPPDDDNTPITPDAIQNLTDLTDDELAQAVIDARNAQMPNMLADVSDITQRFIYTIGANEKPLVLDNQAFKQFMSDNNIPQSEVLARSVDDISYTNNDGTHIKMTADRVSRLLKYSRFNYIGGKHGGQAYGAGTYFDMNGGRNTGYGSTTINAVLNPATARVITDTQLYNQAAAFSRTHPKFAAAIGKLSGSFSGGSNTMSIYAMAMGYNVIKNDYGTYYNVIDRKAIVYRRDDT